VKNIKITVHTVKVMQRMPIIDTSICHHLHAVKMLLYAESVGVVTSGHVTKCVAKLFDPQWPKIPCYTQTARLSPL